MDLLKAPRRLRELGGSYSPLSHLQRSLAVLALVDGAARFELAAGALEQFRREISARVSTEAAEREASRDRADRERPRFHEWLKGRLDSRLFPSLRDDDTVLATEMPEIERRFATDHVVVEDVEDRMIYRLIFASV
jgi:hypothetical protein